MKKIRHRDWGIDVRYLAGRDREAVAATNRHRRCRERIERMRTRLRGLR